MTTRRPLKVVRHFCVNGGVSATQYDYDGVQFNVSSPDGAITWLSDWSAADRLVADGIAYQRWIGEFRSMWRHPELVMNSTTD